MADEILLRLQHALGNKPNRTPEEQEFIVRMYSTWDDARDLGRAEARAGDVLIVLEARGIDVPAEVRERILAQKDPERLERWLRRAAIAASAAEVLGKRGGAPAAARQKKAPRPAPRH